MLTPEGDMDVEPTHIEVHIQGSPMAMQNGGFSRDNNKNVEKQNGFSGDSMQ